MVMPIFLTSIIHYRYMSKIYSLYSYYIS